MTLRIYLADLIHEKSGNYVIPLNIGSIAAYAKHRFGDDVEIKLFKHPSALFQAVDEAMPDVIGLSNYSWNYELNKVICKRLRSRNPDIPICSGGPHIRADEPGAKAHLEANPDIDYYCMMEGEQPFANLIEYFLSGPGAVRAKDCDADIPGLAYRSRDGQFHFSIVPFEKKELEQQPSPYLTGILDEFLMSEKLTPMIETNRGCPFHCTYCTWGISALDKVRVFPIERVMEEVEYVAEKSPSPRWFFADANFGSMKRDIDIAKKIKEVSETKGKLNSVLFWWGKNSSNRTKEIIKITDKLCNPLVAVQSLDPEVLENIKRSNINLDDMREVMDAFHNQGLEVTTDILVGLPGESYASHIETLRKSCEFGFDFIGAGNIRLLPGSEMESDEAREKYDIQTRYRLISNAYGRYEGEYAFEYEEGVRATSAISEEEMFKLRLVHFLLWALINLGLARPLLRWAQKSKNVNPIDLIFGVIEKPGNDKLSEFFDSFENDSRTEWFDTIEELHEYAVGIYDELEKNPFLKINYKYVAILLLNKEIARALLDSIVSQIDDPMADGLSDYCYERIWFVGDPIEKTIKFAEDVIDKVDDVSSKHIELKSEVKFTMSEANKTLIDYDLKKNGFDENQVLATTQAIENYIARFQYDVSA